MTIKQKIKIGLVTQNMTTNLLAVKLGVSRQLLYHYISKKNIAVISKIEVLLNLKEGSLLQDN